MRKTFKYKAKINNRTEANCLEWLYCRTLYNCALEQRILFWKQHKTSAVQQMAELPILKAELPEFKKVGSQVLQNIGGMVKHGHLSKSIPDVAWGMSLRSFAPRLQAPDAK